MEGRKVWKVVTTQTLLSRHKGGMSHQWEGQVGRWARPKGEVLTLGVARHAGVTIAVVVSVLFTPV